MSRHEATFEVNSKTDAHAVRLLVEQAHDTLREELREIDQWNAPVKETLQQFEAIREAARHPSPGTLTVIYEPRDETFDDRGEKT